MRVHKLGNMLSFKRCLCVFAELLLLLLVILSGSSQILRFICVSLYLELPIKIE